MEFSIRTGVCLFFTISEIFFLQLATKLDVNSVCLFCFVLFFHRRWPTHFFVKIKKQTKTFSA